MGLTINNSNSQDSNQENPELREDFYQARLKEVNAYEKDGRDKLAIIFEVYAAPDDEDSPRLVEVGLFNSAAVTTYSDETKSEADIEISDSDLGALFKRLDMVEEAEAEIQARLAAASWNDHDKEDIPSGFLTEEDGGFKADDSEDHVRERERELIADVVEAQLGGEFFRVQVETPPGDGGSLVNKVSGGLDESEVDDPDAFESEAGDEEESGGSGDTVFDDDEVADELDDEKDSLNA
jgi:hypothetical protein